MTAKQFVVVSFSFGTGLLCLGCVALLSLALLVNDSPVAPPVLDPPRLGPPPSVLKEAMENWQYGPVNKAAQGEMKDGLLSRLRERRQNAFRPTQLQSQCQPQCQPQQFQQQGQQVHIVCPPKAYVGPSDCTSIYSSVVSQPTVVPTPLPQLEYPSSPSDAGSLFGVDLGPSRDRDPRRQVKTGQYVCSHCRQSCVGSQWHTDWQPDGSPLTFICERCNRMLSVEQKRSVYKAYMAKQSKQSSIGALHPELE